jgi:hypothetical protein
VSQSTVLGFLRLNTIKQRAGNVPERYRRISLSNGVRVKGQSKDGMEVSPHNIQFKSLANDFAILLQTFLPQSRRLTGF